MTARQVVAERKICLRNLPTQHMNCVLVNTQLDKWAPRGEAFWRSVAVSCGVSSQLALMFCVGKSKGLSNAAAARFAEAGGQPNAAGYRLARSSQVQRLLATANAMSDGEPIGEVDRNEAKSILSALARSSDPSVRIRACESLEKIREAEAAERATEDQPHPEGTLAEIAEGTPWLALMLGLKHSVKLPDAVAKLTREEMHRYNDQIKRLIDWHYDGRKPGECLKASLDPDHPSVCDRSQWPAGKVWDGEKESWIDPADRAAEPTPEATAHGDQPADDQEPPD